MAKRKPPLRCDRVRVLPNQRYQMFRVECEVNGVLAGNIEVWKREESKREVMSVTGVVVNPGFRRRGLATQLYEVAAQTACEQFGLPLASDRHLVRSKNAEAFWKKQARKGRTECIGESGTRRCQMHVLRCPAPASLARAGLGGGGSRGKSKKPPKPIVIEGQEWVFVRKTYWQPDRVGGYRSSVYDAVRVSDGKTVTGSSTKERLIEVIAQRIRDGIY